MCAADPCSKTEISKTECAKKKCGEYQGSLTTKAIARQSDAFPCEETWALAYSDLQKKMIDDRAFGTLGKQLKRKIAVLKCKDDDGEDFVGGGQYGYTQNADLFAEHGQYAEDSAAWSKQASMERGIRRPGAHHLSAETEALEEALDALSDAIA